MSLQSSADVIHLQQRLRDLELRTTDLAQKVGSLAQAAQLVWNFGNGGSVPGGGLWGYIAAGVSVPGMTLVTSTNGTLGSITIAQCTRSGAVLTPSATDTYTVFNIGGAFTTGTNGLYVKIGQQADGALTIDVAGCS